MQRQALSLTRKITVMGMMAAISIVLVYLVHFPIFPGAAFLEYDPADIPIFIGTFLFGPVSGLVLTVVTAGIQALTVSAQSGPYGFIMHVLATGSFALVAGNIYRRAHTRRGAVVALAAGVAAMVVMMVFANLLITPAFMMVPRQAVRQMLLPVIIPFNLIKAGANALITFIIYKKIGGGIFGAGLEHPGDGGKGKEKPNGPITN